MLLLLPALLMPAGCVYYNTFYHARAAAREAELMREARPPGTEPGRAETDLLERAAEKSGRVLRLHPDSQWADDALLLMGSSCYYQGRYESAKERLNQFISMYPDSELLPEAEYMLASVLLASGEPTAAERLLDSVAYADPPREFSDDALVLIGRARHERELYGAASEAFLEALERFPRSDLRAQMRFLTAENYADMGDLDEAARHYALVQREPGSRKLAFEARIRLAEVDLERGMLDEALEVLSDLKGRTGDRESIDRILLLEGAAQELKGSFEEAIETYEGLAVSNPRSEEAAEAHYRVGVINRDQYEDFEAAKGAFRASREASPRSDVGALAARSIRDIESMVGLMEVIHGGNEAAAADSLAPGDPASDQTGDAEPSDDSERPGSDGREVTAEPRSESGLSGSSERPDGGSRPGTIEPRNESVLPEDPERPAEPGTDDLIPAAADSATAAAVGDTASAEPEPESENEQALARFHAAELYLLSFDDPERALPLYRSVVELFPESGLAPKAALAAAWVLDRYLGDIAGAVRAYSAVVRDYPDTEFSEAAEVALGRLNDGSVEGSSGDINDGADPRAE